ncbi:MAG: hypothetical protein H0U23_04825 [Blastocatellia bacterium]|nr:hypothetical protein [Blastocatellia bacterium]
MKTGRTAISSNGVAGWQLNATTVATVEIFINNMWEIHMEFDNRKDALEELSALRDDLTGEPSRLIKN